MRGKYIRGYWYDGERLRKRRARDAVRVRRRYEYVDHNTPNGARDQLLKAIDKLVEEAQTHDDDTQLD